LRREAPSGTMDSTTTSSSEGRPSRQAMAVGRVERVFEVDWWSESCCQIFASSQGFTEDA
jgi:hypothetical protein